MSSEDSTRSAGCSVMFAMYFRRSRASGTASAARSTCLSSPSSRIESRSVRVSCPMRARMRSDAKSPLSLTASAPGALVGRFTSAPSLGHLLENLVELLVQRCSRERLHDITARACLSRGDNVFLLRLGRHHQHRQMLEVG